MNTPAHDDPAVPEQAVPGPAATEPATLEVGLGSGLPSAATRRLPMLNPGLQGVDNGTAPASSRIAEGLHFSGHARLQGPLSVAGVVEGNLLQADGAQVSVVVTETGRVQGDIVADKISVMGTVSGLLNAGSGHVTLHDGSSITGHVRYGRIQVNGADLNATLERVAAGHTPPRHPAD